MRIIIILLMLLISTPVFGLTFPIDKEDCIIKNGRILLTGWFWEKREEHLHKGMDIPARVHTPVRAVKSGKVIEKGFQYMVSDIQQAYGNYIKIVDDDGFIWTYGHLNSYDVKKDELVNEGQIIGTVGWTGLAAKAPHLHLDKRNKNNKKIIFTKDFGIKFSLRR